MNEQLLERLVAARIQVIPVSEIDRHIVFERDGFVALVVYRDEALGNIGAAGLATERGLAPLTWRQDKPFFVTRGFQQEATAEQVDALRSFEHDLREALA